MKVLLMCFSNIEEYKNQLQEVREIFRPEGGIFVLGAEESEEVFITFNTTYDFRRGGYIKINKKRETNTLFTIDAINWLSEQVNGRVDKGFIPDWELYRNSILLLRGGEFTQIRTKLREVIQL